MKGGKVWFYVLFCDTVLTDTEQDPQVEKRVTPGNGLPGLGLALVSPGASAMFVNPTP